MYNKIIKEILKDLNINYTYLSKDWLIKLEKDNKIKYLAANKFPLDNHPLGLIMDDKYATYEILNNLNIPACIHQIIYRENNRSAYAKNNQSREDILKYYNMFNRDVIIKPNNGAMGIDVYHITDETILLNKVKELLIKYPTISICPFYHIRNEYRAILLDNEIKLLYKKINPAVIGDGKSTLKELLVKFNPHYFKDLSVPDMILKKNEEYTYDFHFNLSKGSIVSTEIDKNLYDKISSLATTVTTKMGIRFASVDVIETINNELLVLEINSGVTINKAIDFIPNGYEVTKNIYKEAIIKLMNE